MTSGVAFESRLTKTVDNTKVPFTHQLIRARMEYYTNWLTQYSPVFHFQTGEYFSYSIGNQPLFYYIFRIP